MDKTIINEVIKVLDRQRTELARSLERAVTAYDHRVIYEVAHKDIPTIIKRLESI